MVTSTLVIMVAVLLVGQSCAEQATPPTTNVTEKFLNTIVGDFEDDGFSNVITKETGSTDRKKRSAGGFGGFLGNNNAFFGNAGNNGYGFGAGCGSVPASRVNFVGCFTPGNVAVQRNYIIRSYYRQGNYGQCLNYFRSLPVVNVVPVANGYSGQLFGSSGRSYTVNACPSCCGGNPGILVQCNNRPYSRLVRQFVFRPQINNVNYNNYNSYNVQQPVVADVGYVSDSGYGGYGYGDYGYGNAGCATC